MDSKLRRGGASHLFGLFGLMLVFSPMFGPSEAFVFPQYNQLTDTMFASRIALMVCFILSCSLFLYYDKLSEKGKHGAVLACAVLCAVSMLFTSLPALGASEVFLVAGAAMRGLGYGTLALVWVFEFTKLRGNGIGVALSEALLFYGIACTVTSFVADFSPLVATALLIACPLTSGIGCVLVDQRTPPPEPFLPVWSRSPQLDKHFSRYAT